MEKKIAPDVFVAPGAAVVGDVTLCEGSSVWYNATLRGDNAITIGKNSNVQDNCVLHAEAGHLVNVGEGVTIGHNAIVHGCTIGDNTLVGMGAIVLNDAVIGKNCIIGAGALVTQRSQIPDNSLLLGSPAKIVREVKPEEAERNAWSAAHYVELAQKYKNGERG